MTLSGPRLDHLTGCIPARLHHSLAHAAAQSSLLDHLVLSQSRVELWHHHVTILTSILADVLILFLSFYFQCHNCQMFFMVNTKGSGLTCGHFRLHLPYQIRLPSAPICESFLSLPWARKTSLVGSQIFIFIDDAKVQKIQMQNKPFFHLSQIYLKC